MKFYFVSGEKSGDLHGSNPNAEGEHGMQAESSRDGGGDDSTRNNNNNKQ